MGCTAEKSLHCLSLLAINAMSSLYLHQYLSYIKGLDCNCIDQSITESVHTHFLTSDTSIAEGFAEQEWLRKKLRLSSRLNALGGSPFDSITALNQSK